MRRAEWQGPFHAHAGEELVIYAEFQRPVTSAASTLSVLDKFLVRKRTTLRVIAYSLRKATRASTREARRAGR